jgi:hypothetical protein
MIITEKIEIRCGNMMKYYLNLGYNVTSSKELININVCDLPIKSSHLIDVKCDYCECIKKLRYSKYNINTHNNNRKYSCSKKCSMEKTKETNLIKYGVEFPTQNNEILNKRNINNLEKYGVENPIQLEEIKNKAKKTNLIKYGVDNIFKNQHFINNNIKTMNNVYGGIGFSSKIINSKIKETNLIKYGVETPIQLEEIKNKAKKTNLIKFGVDNIFKNKDFINNNIKKLKKINNINIIKKYNGIMSNEYNIIEYKDGIFNIEHDKKHHNFLIRLSTLYDRSVSNTTICTLCNPINNIVSDAETKVSLFVKSLGVDVVENDRTVLNGKELDIYIPSKNIGIEFNGNYWHSEKYKDKNYHLNKTLKCQEKEIHLLHIFEDDWLYKKDIVESIIKNKLGKIDSDNKIYARKTEIREVKSDKARLFLNENHIQGFSKSTYKLGLYYENELVSLMTFGYRKTNTKKEFELIRFCNKLNTNVIGASSRLFKYFLNNYQIEEDYILSYADISMFDGKMYDMLGFKEIHLTVPNYFWVVNGVREHRWKYNKQNLIKEGFSKDKTEVEIMHSRNYYRIFGCGQKRYEYKL